MDPENRQDDFWITASFSSVFYSPHVQESRSNCEKIFLGAVFDRNPKLTIHRAGKKNFLTAYLNS